MAEETQAIRGISWRETFPFTHLFRTFRVAIHPSKLVLGLAALIVLFVGGSFLDTIWAVKYRAVPNEVEIYEASRYNPDVVRDFRAARAVKRASIESDYAALLGQLGIVTDRKDALVAAQSGKRLGDVKDKIIQLRNEQVAALNKTQANSEEAARLLNDPALKAQALANARTIHDQAVEKAYTDAADTYEMADTVRNTGIFEAFFTYERVQFNAIVLSVKRLSWIDGYHAIEKFFTVGPVWLLAYHPIYFFLYLILFTATWAIFGGAIARIAAVHVARDEKLSIRAALRFSSGKFLSFLFAPIIPLMIVAALGVAILLLTAVVIWIPFFGPIIVGAFFFILLAIGFVMALVLVGTVGGFNMMYPTIAVEGSDSFDAISRSFSYLYARPWRLAFYTMVSVAYGAITYTFLKLFIGLMLTLIHTFAGYGVFNRADNTRPLWDMLWPGPGGFGRLSYVPQTLSLGNGQTLGAYLIEMWVYLVIFILGAYAISFYFSANTIIYYLMRNEVDATDMDDVFVEQQDDDLVDASPAAPTAPAAPAPEPETVNLPTPEAPPAAE